MERAQIVSLLLERELFQTLTNTEIESLISQGNLKKYAKRSYVAMAGDHWDKFFIVLTGTIAAQKVSIEGRNLWISEFNRADVFWGFAFFDPSLPMPVTLVAVGSTELLVWDRSAIQRIMETNGRFSWAMLLHMAKAMFRASSIVEGLAFHPVAGRIANFLLEKYPAEDVNFSRDLTLDEIAARAGTTREMVCRSLQRFATEGMIEITRTELRIRDRAKLESSFDLKDIPISDHK